MFKGVIHLYETQYKKLLLIPVALFILCLLIIGNHYLKTGEFISKGVSLKGGTTLSISQQFNVDEMTSFLLQRFPNADTNVRTLSKGGQQVGIIIEAADIKPDDLVSAVQEKMGPLQKSQYTADTTGPSLGASFYKQAIISVIIAFILMGLVVYLYFRVPLPSAYAVGCVFADMLFAIAMIDIFNVKVTTAGIAAILMLIGYSIDTDILLTTRVLKRTEGTVSERMASTIPTGLTMTGAAIAAVVVAYISTGSELLKQIMFILFWGLIADVIYTWLMNAALLRMYMERKAKEAQ